MKVATKEITITTTEARALLKRAAARLGVWFIGPYTDKCTGKGRENLRRVSICSPLAVVLQHNKMAAFVRRNGATEVRVTTSYGNRPSCHVRITARIAR